MKERKHAAKIAFSVPEDLRKRLKIKTINEGTTIKDLITDFISTYLKKKGKKYEN